MSELGRVTSSSTLDHRLSDSLHRDPPLCSGPRARLIRDSHIRPRSMESEHTSHSSTHSRHTAVAQSAQHDLHHSGSLHLTGSLEAVVLLQSPSCPALVTSECDTDLSLFRS